MRIYHDNTNQLIICYRLVHTEQMIQSFPVPRTLAQQWHIPEKELFLTTGQNAETFFPPALFDMGKFLSCYNNPDRHTGQKTEAENIIRETRPLPPALYILTNQIAVNGADKWYIAVVILGKDFLWNRTVRNHRNVS